MKNLILFILFFFFFSACGNGYKTNDSALRNESIAMETTNTSESLQSQKETDYSESQQEESNQSSSKTAKKIIKTGRITLEVADFQKARIAIDTLAARYDAYISKESEDRSSYRLSNSLTIKLSPQKFEKFIADLVPLALNIENKNIESRDVTKEFIDLKTRLANKKAVVARYRELLSKANSVKDILAVEEELRKVTEEIESTEGQLKYLLNQVNYSTVYLTYYERLEQSTRHKKGFFARLGNSMEDGWEGLQELVIGLVGAWHIILFFSLVVWGIIRLWRRRKKSPK